MRKPFGAEEARAVYLEALEIYQAYDQERPRDLPPDFLWVQGDPTKESELDKVRLTHAAAVIVSGERDVSPQAAIATGEFAVVEVEDVGVLTTFTIIRIPFEGQKLKPPYCFGAIVLDGADMPIYHLISGVPHDDIRMGMRVKAVWKPKEEWETSLENILYFEPTGEPDAEFDSYKEHL